MQAVYVSQAMWHAVHDDGPHYWLLCDNLRGDELREELEDWTCYDWEVELMEKMAANGCKKVVNTVTGDAGFVYRGRLVIPRCHLGGRTPDRWRLCDFAQITHMK